MCITNNERGITKSSREVVFYQKLHPKTESMSLKVPNNYSIFENEIKKWIRRLVLYRTINPDTGKAWHRENILVEDNASLMDVWKEIEVIRGTEVKIIAKLERGRLKTGETGVEQIFFSVEIPKELILIEPEDVYEHPITKTEAGIMLYRSFLRYFTVHSNWPTPKWERHLSKWLEWMSKNPEAVDDRYLPWLNSGLCWWYKVNKNGNWPTNQEQLKGYFSHLWRDLMPIAQKETEDDKRIKLLREIEERFTKSIYRMNQYSRNYQIKGGWKFVNDWIRSQQLNKPKYRLPGRIYSVYMNVG